MTKSETKKPAPKKGGGKPGKSQKGASVLMRAKFVQEYLSDPKRNGTQAALRAGYAESGARVTASRLLADPVIAAQIDAADRKVIDKLEITRERVLNEIARVAFFSMGDILHITEDGDPFIDLSKAGPDELAALASAEVHDYTDGRGDDARNVRKVVVKPHDKLAALDKLAKHLGLLKETVKLEVDTDFFTQMEEARRRAREGRR